MPVQSESYWLGSLAMTVALAVKDPHPEPLLKNALREFLAEYGNTELGQLLRQTLKESK